jgi:hypothetical protein
MAAVKVIKRRFRNLITILFLPKKVPYQRVYKTGGGGKGEAAVRGEFMIEVNCRGSSPKKRAQNDSTFEFFCTQQSLCLPVAP